MAKSWKPARGLDAPSSIHEITRRYVACAVALAKALGVPLTEAFLRDHRESISCCFIESGRAGVRLPASVQLPPLTADAAEGHQHAATQLSENRTVVSEAPVAQPVGDHVTNGPAVAPVVVQNTNGDALPPTAIPLDSGLPCGGQAIAALKPAQLAMLISKVARLVQDEGGRWVPLLHALQSERQARLAQGPRPKPAPVEGDGHG
jgi:hypothetical protein